MTPHENSAPLPDDDWLERALRDDAREHAHGYLADDGFTARVMAGLPPPLAVPRWRKAAVAAMWSTVAVAAAAAFPEAAGEVARAAFRLAAQPVSLPQIGAAVLAFGAVMWSATAWMLRED
jgi:hypothetical protein